MKQIIVVDDDDAITDIFQIVFDQFEIISYNNGSSILNLQAPQPDLFVIDRWLRGECGLDLCRFIKAETKYKTVPVIILSATQDIKSLGLSAGADVVIEKPFSLNHLKETVNGFIIAPASGEVLDRRTL
jgi:DNA-binding response OmpR family regulator